MALILAADDDAACRRLLTEVLAEVPEATVCVVPDGPSVLALLGPLQPHLLVLDVDMPGLSGLEVYRRLRARDDLAALPVLFVTAATPGDLSHLSGPWDWLAKPYAIDDLLGRVRALLRGPRPALP